MMGSKLYPYPGLVTSDYAVHEVGGYCLWSPVCPVSPGCTGMTQNPSLSLLTGKKKIHAYIRRFCVFVSFVWRCLCFFGRSFLLLFLFFIMFNVGDENPVKLNSYENYQSYKIYIKQALLISIRFMIRCLLSAFSSKLGYEEHIPGQTRDWNEELQTTRELPRKNLPERLLRERAIFKVSFQNK